MKRYFSELPMSTTIGILILSWGLNIVGGALARQLNGLLFLDTIGTAIAAIALGPWWGATIGTLTNLAISQIGCKQQYFNYLVVNVLLGFYWGYLGRAGLALFSDKNNYRKLLFRSLSLGATGGFLASTLALFTTFNFHWSLAGIDPATFRRWHLTDDYYRWLLSKGHINPSGSIIQILVRDVIAILPDKIVSISLAAVIIYYFLPRTEERLRNLSWTSSLRSVPAPPLIFLFVYGISFILLLVKGNVSIDPGTCLITGRSFIPVQIVIWAVPLIWVLISLVAYNRPGGVLPAPTAERPVRELYVKAVYADVLTILAGVFALLIAAKGRSGEPMTAAAMIGALLENGLGMVSFFAIFGFLPGFLLRVFGNDPELSHNRTVVK